MEYITVIGAANMDICAKSHKSIISNDSNPGKVTYSPGGVGRNIAENLARLGANVNLIAPFGEDNIANTLLDGCKAVGVNTDYCYIDKRATTPTYVAILDESGEMNVAVMDNSCPLPASHIEKHASVIQDSSIILLDTNPEHDMLAYMLDIFKGNDIYIDVISVTKAEKIRPFIECFHTIKMNQLEASSLANMTLEDNKDYTKAGEYFLKQGVKRVVISRGAKGLYYRRGEHELWLQGSTITPINSTGAGDALMAGICYCSLLNKDDVYTASFAQEVARMTLMSKEAVNPHITLKKINTKMKGRATPHSIEDCAPCPMHNGYDYK